MQVLGDHLARGGEDPRYIRRQQLLDEGVPLRAADTVKTDKPQRCCGAFVSFMHERDAKRKEAGIVFDKQGYLDFQKTVKEEWDSLTEADRRLRIDLSVQSFQDMQADGRRKDEPQLLPASRQARACTSVVDICGDKHSPVEQSWIEMSLKKLLGIGDDEPIPGLRQLSETVRDKQLPQLYQADEGFFIVQCRMILFHVYRINT